MSVGVALGQRLRQVGVQVFRALVCAAIAPQFCFCVERLGSDWRSLRVIAPARR
ncbi:MAG: hypothetical protein SFY66_00885 [Oculatellaceae cyanobacterium bins.114]|nr:hypothetical protein [Oculatellaceae cyanobacterium bins.114]